MRQLKVNEESFSETFLKSIKNAINIEETTEQVLDFLLENLPLLGDILKNYNIKRKFRNMEELILKLSKRVDVLIDYHEEMSISDKEKYSELLIYAIDSVENYSQVDKIDYLVNGLENMIKVENISYDMGYLYINMLNQLSILDLSVLKLYGRMYIPDHKKEIKTKDDILSSFHIEKHQYRAVQDNLYNLGLLRKRNEKNTEKDFDNIKKNLERMDNNIEQLYSYLKDLIKDKKRKPKLRKFKKGRIKFETKDRYELNRFGRDFVQHFISEK